MYLTGFEIRICWRMKRDHICHLRPMGRERFPPHRQLPWVSGERRTLTPSALSPVAFYQGDSRLSYFRHTHYVMSMYSALNQVMNRTGLLSSHLFGTLLSAQKFMHMPSPCLRPVPASLPTVERAFSVTAHPSRTFRPRGGEGKRRVHSAAGLVIFDLTW